jgi:N-acylneuraminate cytidylyltransferase/CMP-N,N'-diacetyllegionaminic acid synthase
MTTSSGVVLGAICARGGSKGVPRKNLRSLAGRPLLAHTIECARRARTLDALAVSTDDNEIARTAREWGVEVPFLRPAELARDESSKWDVFRHLVQTWEQRENRRVELLVDLDVGVPLRDPEDVDACVRQLRSTAADAVTTAYEPERNPYFNMVECDAEGWARVVKTNGAPITRRQAAPAVYSLSPAVWAVKRDALWAFAHWSQARLGLHVIPRRRALDIDTILDLQMIEAMLAIEPRPSR